MITSSFPLAKEHHASFNVKYLKLRNQDLDTKDQTNTVFHDLSTTQEWQYCQLCFAHTIQNY